MGKLDLESIRNAARSGHISRFSQEELLARFGPIALAELNELAAQHVRVAIRQQASLQLRKEIDSVVAERRLAAREAAEAAERTEAEPEARRRLGWPAKGFPGE